MRGTTKMQVSYNTVLEAIEKYLNEQVFHDGRSQRITSIQIADNRGHAGYPSFEIVLEEIVPPSPAEPTDGAPKA